MLSFEDGLHLLGTDLHLDPRRAKPRAIISHAHADHVGRHKRWVASPGTAALCARRWSARDLEVHDFHTPWREGGATVTLLPAGHILGSSMVLVELAGTRVLYTGDFRLKPSATAEPCTPVRADILVMECTYGEPIYRFPDREAVLDELCDFLEETQAHDSVPVLLAYSLGKAQEVASLLGARGYSLWLHESAWQMAEVYRELGVGLTNSRRYEDGPIERGVLIVPPTAASTALVRRLGRHRSALLSGWAAGPARPFLPRTHAAFPLSDHADFDELLALVARVRPRKIYTLHGPAHFATTLRRQGYDAEPAADALQMSLF